MTSPVKDFGDTATKLSKNPLGIIALFIVLIYGFSALVLGKSDHLQPDERTLIIWFLVIFPFVVLAVFSWLVCKHHKKLYAPSDYSNEENFLNSIETKKHEISILAETMLKIAYILAEGSTRLGGVPDEHVEKIKQYENKISDLLNTNIEDEVKIVLEQLDSTIQQRINDERKIKEVRS